MNRLHHTWLQKLFPFMSWMHLIDARIFRADLLAGITSGVLILPQAIALATLAGLPPQYGLYTSIFPVVIAGLWGSSWHVLSGPNTALAVLLAMSIAPFANIGTPEYVQYAITLTFMMGVLSLAFGLLRLGEIFNYFSHTVMVALVTGVGIIIIIQQAGNFLGVHMNIGEDLHEVLQQLWFATERANIYAVIVGSATVLSGLLIKRIKPRWPHYILAVVIGSLAAAVLNALYGSSVTAIYYLGYLSFEALPFSLPDFSPQNFAEFSNVAYPATLSLMVLALMQSAVIARNTAAKSGQQGMDINQEVVGQGLSNIVGSLLSCFASCGSFNRSAANLEAGARTPMAGMISALALVILVLAATPLIAYLPLPVMAGVLFLVGAALVNPADIRKIMVVEYEARIVFPLVLCTTLFGGVDSGVFLGIFLSIVLYLRSASRPEVDVLGEDEKSGYLTPDMNPDQTTVIALTGSLFFGSIQSLEKVLVNIAREDQQNGHLVIVAEYVTFIDETIASALILEARRRKDKGYRMTLWLRRNAIPTQVLLDTLHKAFGSDLMLLQNREQQTMPGE
jgi:SulP family sulfate permease